MPKKKYIVSLTAEEREYLEKLTTTGKTAAYKINHARVLLKADINQDGGGCLDTRLATVTRHVRFNKEGGTDLCASQSEKLIGWGSGFFCCGSFEGGGA